MALDITIGSGTTPATAIDKTYDTGSGIAIKAIVLTCCDQDVIGLGDRLGTDDTKVCKGFSDGTNDACGGWSGDGGPKENWVVDDQCIQIRDEAGTVLFEATCAFLTGDDAGKFTLSWGTVTGAANIFFYEARTGSDITGVHVPAAGTVLANAEETISGVGFDPTVIECVYAPQNATLGTWDRGSWGTGFGTSPTNRVGIGGRYKTSSGEAGSGIYATNLVTTWDNPAAQDTFYDISAMANSGDGFVLDRTVGVSDVPFVFMAMAGTFQVKAGTILQPASAIDVESVSLSFRPIAVSFISADNDALATDENDCEWCLGAMTGESAEQSLWGGTISSDNDNDSDMVTDACITSRAAGDAVTPHALEARGEFGAFGADTFTLTFTTADTTQRPHGFLAFGAAAAAPGVVGGAYYQQYLGSVVRG